MADMIGEGENVSKWFVMVLNESVWVESPPRLNSCVISTISFV